MTNTDSERAEYEAMVAKPGKFEGQPPYPPYFWDISLDGFRGVDVYVEDDGDDDSIIDDAESVLDYIKLTVTAEDRQLFPELVEGAEVRLYQDDQGFVSVTFDAEETSNIPPITLSPIIEMDTDAIDVTPIDYEWSEGYGETWDFWESCSGGHVVNEECAACSEDRPEGPMMSYYYELPGFQGATRTSRRACCATYRFASSGSRPATPTGWLLLGAGMDLSWEICEAYMRLGYLPPHHFARRPPCLDRRRHAPLPGGGEHLAALAD